jgi:tetratricopeptide (TPR) repeat protein
MGRRSERAAALFCLIFTATLTAYWPAIHGGPLWDDFGHITFPELRSSQGLWRIWSEIGATQQYYPLLHSAFWVEHRLWGDSFTGYHLANVALHSASAVLLVSILRTLAVPGALLAGLIFAMHPVAVETVAWISEQKNTLSTMFYLASAYVYLRATATTRPFSAPTYWVAFVLFICALLSKSVTATLPAAVLVVQWWQNGRLKWREHVMPLVPWFVVAAAAGSFTAWFEHSIIGAQGEGFTLSLLERGLLAGRIIWFYLGKLFWPQNLIFIYPRWDVSASAPWQYVFPAAAIALAVALAVLARKHRGPLAGYLFFCGTLAPVLGFFNVYPFRFSYVADHFQYLAAIGIIVVVAAVLTLASQRLGAPRRRIAMLSGAALIAFMAVLTWHRAAVYRDAETLYRDTIARNPGAWMAYQNLGTELAAMKRFDEAIAAFEGALRARPGYASAEANLLLAHMKAGDAAAESPARVHEAIAHYEAVVRLDPNHFRAHYNAGTLLMDVPGGEPASLRHLDAAVKLQPDSVEAHVNLGMLLANMPSRTREAIGHLEFALARRPDLVEVRQTLDDLHTLSASASQR